MNRGILAANRPAGRALLVALAVVLVAGSAYAHRRWVRGNFHEVVPGSVYRSAQPSPRRLAGWITEHGLAAVLNLNDDGGFADEAAVADEAGIRYLHVPLSDLGLPHRNTFLALLDSLETLPRPLLVHCRAGADRTGMACVLAAMAVGGRSFDEARGQLGYRYLHLESERDAVEGVVLRYEDHCARTGRDPGGWAAFRAWARDHYSHSFLLVEVAAPDTIRAAPGVLDSVTVVIHNRSDTAIPAGDPQRGFRLASYRGSAVGMAPAHEYFPRLEIHQTIAARDSLRVTKRFHSPAAPGVYEIRFDMLEAGVTWFCSAGSPERAHVLVVAEAR
jgi:protein tyrosine/serine phosphatase